MGFVTHFDDTALLIGFESSTRSLREKDGTDPYRKRRRDDVATTCLGK
jgi:hypothetical protein